MKKILIILLVIVLSAGTVTMSRKLLANSDIGTSEPGIGSNLNDKDEDSIVLPKSLYDVNISKDPVVYTEAKSSTVSYSNGVFSVDSISSGDSPYFAIYPYAVDSAEYKGYADCYKLSSDKGVVVDFTVSTNGNENILSYVNFTLHGRDNTANEGLVNVASPVHLRDENGNGLIEARYGDTFINTYGEDCSPDDVRSLRITFILRGMIIDDVAQKTYTYSEVYINGILASSKWRSGSPWPVYGNDCGLSDIRVGGITESSNDGIDYFKVTDVSFFAYGDIDYSECYDESGVPKYVPTSDNDAFIKAFLKNNTVLEGYSEE